MGYIVYNRFFIIIYLELPHVDQIRQFDHAPHLTSIINFGFFVMDFFTAFVKWINYIRAFLKTAHAIWKYPRQITIVPFYVSMI